MVKQRLPFIVLAIAAVLMMAFRIIDFGPNTTKYRNELDVWSKTSTELAFLLGAINFTRLHYGNVKRRRPNWIYSVVAIAAMVVSFIITVSNGVKGPITLFVVDSIANRIDSAIYALLGFYVCSAAYRSFKLKNVEATILLVSAVILMLGQAPIGEVIIPGMSKVSNWVLNVPNSAAMRGIRIGAGIGGFAASIRVVLGLERSWTAKGF